MAANPRKQPLPEVATAGARPGQSNGKVRAIASDSQAAASEHQLRAAWQAIEALRVEAEHQRQKAALLELELASAYRFAFHDELTGLPNRRLLLDRFNQAVARARRQHRQAVLLFLDLDGFKRINDGLGHRAGDRLLQRFAKRLTASIRTSDTACRYGGDEFVVLLLDCKSHNCAVLAARKLCARLAKPYVIEGTSLRITASIGTAAYPDDGLDFDELLQAADRSMYRDKGRGPTPPNVPDCELTRKSLMESLTSDERTDRCRCRVSAGLPADQKLSPRPDAQTRRRKR